MKEFAEILIHKQKVYTYQIPQEFQNNIAVGQEVEIKLRNKATKGYITKFVTKPEFKTQPIAKVISNTAFFDDKLVELAEFISQKYKCLFGTAMKAILPK